MDTTPDKALPHTLPLLIDLVMLVTFSPHYKSILPTPYNDGTPLSHLTKVMTSLTWSYY